MVRLCRILIIDGEPRGVMNTGFASVDSAPYGTPVKPFERGIDGGETAG